MNKAVDIRNPYELPRVVLASISDEIQLDENLEPPFVRVRDTNSQYLEIDASNIPATNNPCRINQVISRSLPRINRLRFQYLSFRNYSPNINPRNNSISFIRGGVPFTAVISPDQHLTGLTRYQALAAAMSTAVGVPGEFTAAAGGLVNEFVITNTAAIVWRFANNSLGVSRGRYLWGFNEMNFSVGTDAVNHSLVWYTENYTRWIDFASAELTQYTKTDISGTNISAEVFFRHHIINVPYGAFSEDVVQNPPALNFDRSRAISTVDVYIVDEFNELYYVPTTVWGSFSFNLSFLTDM